MLKTPIYYDSSTLADLRTLFTAGIHLSDTVVLVATKGVLTRPWCVPSSMVVPELIYRAWAASCAA